MTRLFFLSFLFVSNLAFAQEKVEFKAISKMVIPQRSFGFASDGKSIFVRALDGFEIYSFATNTWEKFKFPLKHLPDADGAFTGYSEAYGKIFTGIRTNGILEVLDISSLELGYAKLDGIPYWAGSDSWENKIYLFGGLIPSEIVQQNQPANFFTPTSDNEKTHSEKLTVFDPGNATFTELAALPTGRITKGRFVDGKLFVFGGNNWKEKFDDILCYDPKRNVWNTLGHLPHPMVAHCVATDGKRIYLIGCVDFSGYLGIYDPATNHYSEYPTNLKLAFGGALVRDNKLYYFGGSNVIYSKQINNKLYVLDLASLPK